MRVAYLIGGPNGAGKTTTAQKLLPHFLDIHEFVNADVIATGLSAFNPMSVSFDAGRLLLKRVHELLALGKDFAFETTLASRSFATLIKSAKGEGYRFNLIYIWLRSPELAVRRVEQRVKTGGHFVEEEVVRRRYHRGLQNLTELYLPLADDWKVYDNSGSSPRLIAAGSLTRPLRIFNNDIWKQIRQPQKR